MVGMRPAWGLALLLFPVWSACQSSPKQSVVARVDGRIISAQEFRSRLREYRFNAEAPLGPTPEMLALKKRLLGELIGESILLAEAERRKLKVTPLELQREVARVTEDYPGSSFEEVLAEKHITRSRWQQRLRENLLMEKVIQDITRDVPAPSDTAVETYFRENPEEFRQEEALHLEQIVVKTRADGQRILDELAKGADFAALARKHSFTPDAAQGGDLGFVPRSALVKPMQEAVKTLKLKTVSPVIQTEYGFHVVRVQERRPAKKESLEHARPRIVRILTQQDRENVLRTWRQEAITQAKIERNHALLAEIR